MENDPEPTPSPEDNLLGGFFSNILTPGSSLNPSFLLILDGAFVTLLLVLVALAALTHGNLHLIFLIVIECCLWASVKWFVSELQNARAQEAVDKATEMKPKVD